MDILNKQKYVFTRLFLLANKVQVIGDWLLSGEITIKQWLLAAAVAQLGEPPPAISEVAEFIGNSHQNVKQLAVKLQEKGYLLLEKDKKDFRITRLRLKEKNICFWQRSQNEIKEFLDEIFNDFGDDEIDSLYRCLNKLYENIKKNNKN